MTYPKTILTKTIRRIILGFLILIFFVAAPLLLMYAAGYRYDWKSRRILETGVISIDVHPDDAQIYISGIEINKKLPIRLTNRAPGTYNLKIEKLGYKPWEKNIVVKSKQTTYIKEVSLLKDSLPVPIFSKDEKGITAMFPSSDGNYIIIASKKDDMEILELFNTQTNDLDIISKLPPKTNSYIEWSPFDNYFLISKIREETKSITIFDSNNIEISKTYIIKRDNNINHYQWQKNTPLPTIFTRDGDYLARYTINNSERIHKINTTDSWFVDAQERLWTTKEGMVHLVSSKEKKDEVMISVDAEALKIIDINEERAILKSGNQINIISRKADNATKTINTPYFRYNPATKEWLAWSPWELWAIYEHDSPALLNRTSDNIVFVSPLDGVGSLLVANENGITAFNPGYYVSHNLFSGNILGASVNQKIKKIFFLGKVGGREGLFELEY